MAEPIVVIGAGGFGRETLDVIEAINRASESNKWDVIGVVDDRPSDVHLSRLCDRSYTHLGSLSRAKLPDGCLYVVGVGSPIARAKIVERVADMGGRFATLIHPTAVLGSRSFVGPGSVICSGVQISTNVRLGSHVQLNPAAIVGHDSTLANFVSINPGAVVSGEVCIEPRVLVGAAALILQGLRVGKDAVVGGSACVTRDVPSGATVKGVPAR